MLLTKLKQHPSLPIPQMANGSTFIAMVTEVFPDGKLREIIADLVYELASDPMGSEPYQEFYNWTEDKLPEMDRIRLVWMFGNIRYELDAGTKDVFGDERPTVFEGANYIGENVNTVIRPEP